MIGRSPFELHHYQPPVRFTIKRMNIENNFNIVSLT